MTSFAHVKWALQLLCGLKVAGLGEGSRQRSGLGEMGVQWEDLACRVGRAAAGRGWQVWEEAVGCLAEASTEGCQGAGPWEEAWCRVPKARNPVETF